MKMLQLTCKCQYFFQLQFDQILELDCEGEVAKYLTTSNEPGTLYSIYSITSHSFCEIYSVIVWLEACHL